MMEKNHSILMAAANLFARYGYSKTTMGDIATEAGVARQTVYNAFPGKEEILRAVVRQTGEGTYFAVLDIWKDAKSLDDKLAAFQNLGPLKWFEMISASPDWASLMDGVHQAASEELAAQDVKWRASLFEMVQSDAPKGQEPSSTHQDIVDFFYSGSLNAKYGVTDVAHLRSRLATIRAATLALLMA